MIAAAVAAFLAVFVAEFGDKTQLITMTMACRYPAPQVLSGALIAMGAVMGLAVIAGSFIYKYIPHNLVSVIAGLIFILIGLYYGFRREKKEDPVNCRGGLLPTMCLVFLAEFGDKSQLATMMLAAGTGYPVAVFAGAMAAILCNHLLAVFLGSRIVSRLKPLYLKAGTALLFIIIGLAMVVMEQFLS